MRRYFRGLAALLVALVLTVPAPGAQAGVPYKSLTVLFTHDMHDHVYPDGEDVGGWVRLATLLESHRQSGRRPQKPDGTYIRNTYPTITVDGGDFSMGSLLQTAYATDAPELRLMGRMGYDVATLGNHEFDYRLEGFTQMLNAAVDSGEALPRLVMANYKPPQDSAEAWEAWNRYGVEEYTIIQREGLRVALFGIMGHNSHEYAPMSGMILEDPIQAAQRVVEAIRADGGADFVICLSHSGTEGGKGEDYDLAKKVKGIDLIVSGHTHTTLEEPILVGGTAIVSAGPYTQNLGRVTLSKPINDDEGLEIQGYDLLPIDARTALNPDMEEAAGRFKAMVEAGYLARYGLRYDETLATVTGGAMTVEQTGNVIGDSYISAVRALEGEDYVPVDFAVVPSGVIRGTLAQGAVTTAQAFEILSLGSGADGSPGYPLISAWVTGADLENAFEVDASISPFMDVAQLYGAGMEWSFETHRMLLDKVTSARQLLPDGSTAELERDRLYRVVTDLYSGQMLGAVEDKSFGLLSITPRDAQGEPVEDFEALILTGADGAEVKAWSAFASYLKGEGSLAAPTPRKTVGTSWNPLKLLANPGLPTLAVLALVLAAVGLAVLVVRLALGRRRRKGRASYRRYRGK